MLNFSIKASKYEMVAGLARLQERIHEKEQGLESFRWCPDLLAAPNGDIEVVRCQCSFGGDDLNVDLLVSLIHEGNVLSLVGEVSSERISPSFEECVQFAVADNGELDKDIAFEDF